jgi:hypothetical protein
MDGWDAESLARAVPLARQRGPEEASHARARAAEFTWQRTAAHVRATLSKVIAAPTTGPHEDHGTRARPAAKVYA